MVSEGRFPADERLAEERAALRPLPPARNFYRAPEQLVHERVELRFDRDQVCHRGAEVARYRRSYEQGAWLPPPIMRPEPPAAPPALVLPRTSVAPPELADYAELCA